MAKIRPHDPSRFYTLLGRWFYSQAKLPEDARSPSPSQREDGWIVNVPQGLVEFLQQNGCELDLLPD